MLQKNNENQKKYTLYKCGISKSFTYFFMNLVSIGKLVKSSVRQDVPFVVLGHIIIINYTN